MHSAVGYCSNRRLIALQVQREVGRNGGSGRRRARCRGRRHECRAVGGDALEGADIGAGERTIAAGDTGVGVVTAKRGEVASVAGDGVSSRWAAIVFGDAVEAHRDRIANAGWIASEPRSEVLVGVIIEVDRSGVATLLLNHSDGQWHRAGGCLVADANAERGKNERDGSSNSRFG